MKEINLPSGNYIFVEVPDNAYDFELNEDDFTKVVLFKTQNNIDSVEIPKISFQIISTTNDITEEQCESIVEKYTNYETEREQLLDGMYEDYLQKGNYWVHDSSGIKLWAFKTAKESLQSLIQSVGLDLKLNYLIIKKL